MKRLSLGILAVFVLLPLFGQDASSLLLGGKPTTETQLLLSADSAKPGETIWAGVDLKMASGWHTYWRFGGDGGIGIPTSVKWKLPAGITAGEIHWPVPEKAATPAGAETLYTYQYEDRAVLLVPIKLGSNLPSGPTTLTADIAWMECKTSCSIFRATITAKVNVGAEDKPSPDAALLEKWQTLLPKTDATAKATAHWEKPSLESPRALIIDIPTASKTADFFPYENQPAEMQGATEVLPSDQPGHVLLRKLFKKGAGNWPDKIMGIVVTTNAPQPPQGMEMAVAVEAAPVVHASVPSVLLELLIAFLAGLILNIMPCVLPVIALKVLGFVNQSKESPERVKRLGLVYGGGVLLSFLILAGLAIAAQHAGSAVGWGDAIRHPQFRIVLTILMTLIALNLFGLFEITLSSSVTGSAADLASKSGYGGALFNGMLATLLATPCTAPYLAGALGFAATQPPVVILLIFLAIGTGLAFPFVLICWQPRLLKVLPKPGAWMEKFKIAMGFPMLATALWLVYASTRDQAEMLQLEFFLATVALAVWLWGQFVQRGARRRGLAAALCAVLVAAGYFVILPKSSKSSIDWKVWSASAVEDARKGGHPVLVDFTAKTCLTCIGNKLSSIEISQTEAKLKEIGAETFVADFTDEDPAIARELAHWRGSVGVPLVLVYSKDPTREPQVLPTLLTPSIVLAALDQAAK